MQWFYAINNERQGPVTDAEFNRLVAQGIILADTLVWRQGMPNWQPYAQVAPSLPPPILPSLPAVGSPPVPGESPWIQPAGVSFATGTVPLRPTFRYGGFWIRLLAKLIDGMILLGVGLAAAAVVRMFWFKGFVFDPSDPSMIGRLLVQEAVMFPLGMVIGLSFDLFFLGKYAATPGKLALGLRVVRADGSPLSTGRIVGRFFAEKINAFTLYIGYMIAGFDDEKRGLHDYICDTRVIKKSSGYTS